jgi:hypothetical protein
MTLPSSICGDTAPGSTRAEAATTPARREAVQR